MKKTLLIALLFIMSCSVPWFHKDPTAKLSGATASVVKTYTQCGVEWNWCDFKQSKPSTQVVRFGSDSKFTFKTFTGYGAQCNWNNFTSTDVTAGTLNRVCAVETTTTVDPPVTVDTYTDCAAEWAACKFTGTRTVRFGVPGHYVYQSLAAKNLFPGTGILCRNDVFGSDPAPTFTKTCSLKDNGTVVPPVVVPPVVVPPVVVPPVVVPPVVVPPVVTPPVVVPPVNGQAVRPSYNKGVGFFVLGTHLYDANGNEFVLRGTNKTHWDNGSPGLNKINANATRWIIDFNQSATNNVAMLGPTSTRAGSAGQKDVVIPGNWDGTCKEDPAIITNIVNTWVAQAASWTQLEKYSIINIANEWGPDSTVWRDTYITAVQRLRAAGYHATIMIDAAQCGQSPNSIVTYGAAILAADPEHNIIFSQHVYGYYRDEVGGQVGQWSAADITKHFANLHATGLAVVIGEFGPGRNVGPSPTPVTPQRIVEVATANGLGYLGWSVDDNSLANCMADDNSFSYLWNACGDYTQSSDLTTFGKAAVEDPKWGLKVMATPASIFQ